MGVNRSSEVVLSTAWDLQGVEVLVAVVEAQHPAQVFGEVAAGGVGVQAELAHPALGACFPSPEGQAATGLRIQAA